MIIRPFQIGVTQLTFAKTTSLFSPAHAFRRERSLLARRDSFGCDAGSARSREVDVMSSAFSVE